MKLSLSWLKDFTNIPEELSVEELAHDLTMRTVEVEGYENPADKLDGIVVGVIRELSEHPDADRLRVCQTDIGEDAPLQIVCGGSNLYEGQKVAVAVPGAEVRWHGEGEPVKIKRTKLRGVKSEGMICGASELGLEELLPPSSEEEIIDLKEFTAEPGEALAKVLELDDYILEIDNKSMTNRPDLWGHYGMAREFSAIYNTPLKEMPEFELPEDIKPYKVEVKTENCKRYAAAVFEGLKVEQSPYTLRRRLWSVGQRPINNLVDITNYAMMTTGQPTHGFDLSHVPGGIVVRQARDGEELELLDKTLLTLEPSDMLITDGDQALALAGVMGGKKDSILPDTESMILEVASFDAMCIRRTTQRHNLRTEASTRFEKDIDTARVDQTLAYTQALIKKLIPEAELKAFGEDVTSLTEPSVIKLPLDFLNVRIGRELSAADVKHYLAPLGFSFPEEDEASVTVKAPVWRSTGDISLPDDLLEEIARMIGYENFDFVPPAVKLTGFVKQPKEELDRRLREYLAYRCGFQEIYTYPWVHERYINAAAEDSSDWVELEAPPSPEERLLRGSLIPNLLEASADNLRYFEDFRIFELSQVFHQGSYSPSEPEEILPEMRRELGGALAGEDPVLLFRQAKGVIEAMPELLHIEALHFAHEQKPSWADPEMWLNIKNHEDEIIGSMGLISLKAEHEAGIRHRMVFLFCLNTEKLQPLDSRENIYKPLPRYPEVEQDLNIVTTEETSWQAISEIAERYADRCRFIEEYHGKQLPEGRKSVIFRYWISSDERTLTSDDIEKTSNKILKALHKELGASLRS